VSRENDLEGQQDQGGKHGGQAGMPKPVPRPARSPEQGIVLDEKRPRTTKRQTAGPTLAAPQDVERR
jgi:hypothetical protein